MKRCILLAGVTLALAGCASTSIERSTNAALQDARTRSGFAAQLNRSEQQRADAQAAVDKLLQQALSQDDAVRIALLDSPALQALLAEHEALQAATIQRGRIANPVFTFERLTRGESLDIGRMLSVAVLDVLSWPWRALAADAQSTQLQLQSTQRVLQTVADVRQAWVKAVAAQQALAYFGDVRIAAEASAELAARMHGAGNFNKLQRAREHAFYADAVTQQARAQHAARAAREQLVRTLGLNDAQAARLQLPERLPDLPTQANSLQQPDAKTRLDVQLARAQLETTARQRGYTSASSWLSGVHLGIQRNSETNEPIQRGFELEVPLPIFDIGDAQRAQADAGMLAAYNRARQVDVEAQSHLTQAYHAYRTSYDIARHYHDQIVPLRKAIAEENLYRYNGMLIGVFELLADAREQVASVIAAIDAQKDFWLAHAALQSAQIGLATNLMMQTPAVSSGGAPKDH